ncbi:MAG TPA: hypothetical protein VF705_07315, partial [Longimicrobium sp.]
NATGVSVVGIADPPTAISPPGKFEVGLPDLIRAPFARNHCPSPSSTLAPTLNTPCPELLSAEEPGTMAVNYRNEPLALRVRDPASNGQAAGTAGDLSHAFRSIARVDPVLNTHGPYAQRRGVGAYDPFTPLLRAYEGDRVQIRVLVGAHEEGHNFSVHGVQWLMEPSEPNSGYRNSQMMGISEHYEFVLPPLPRNNIGPEVDYLYRAGSASDDLWNGTWGILRASQRGNGNFQLLKLPSNPGTGSVVPANASQYSGVCPVGAPAQSFDITAVLARNALPGGRLVYNSRPSGGFGPIFDPNAILYVRTADLNFDGTLKSTAPVEPLVLRANAGSCINVTLRNRLPASPPDTDGWNTLPTIIDQFNANDVRPSGDVGLHVQAMGYDVSRSDGVNVGLNPIQTAAPGGTQTYQWYAGSLTLRRDSIVSTPIAFGGLNLMPADPIEHASKGAVGAMVVWPRGWTFREDSTTRTSATVTNPLTAAVFRDHVVVTQTDLNLHNPAGPIRNLAEAEDPEDSGQKGVNYRTEPMWLRKQFAPDTPLSTTRTF